jgi:hypothetical protein
MAEEKKTKRDRDAEKGKELINAIIGALGAVAECATKGPDPKRNAALSAQIERLKALAEE